MLNSEQKKFYLTTPIYYVNARPHIGHAYTTIVCDAIARRRRLLGDDTFFLTGTDEHGQKIERSAAAAGVAPQQFADEVSAQFRVLWDRMGLTYDDYIRTTESRHKQGVQRLFAKLQANGAIYLDTYTGQYCVSDEAYVDGPPGVVCPDCGNVTETVSESNFYFRLSQYQERLLAVIESNDLLIQPESRRNEVLAFVRSGLKDLSISRTGFRWGIPVAGEEQHVIYVWLDALANYMTAIGYGSDAAEDVARFERFWPADLHLIGKEISRFHCVYWPAFLMAAELPLPRAVVANGWLLFEESKMSKSRGNVVRTETILDAFGTGVYAKQFPQATKREQDLFAADVLRYFLLREVPFGQDGNFSFDALVTRYNADLANGFGNLVSRTLNLIAQNFSGSEAGSKALGHAQIPPLTPDNEESAKSYNRELRQQATELVTFFAQTEDSYVFSTKLQKVAEVIQHVDSFMSEHKPWAVAGQIKDGMGTVYPNAEQQAEFDAQTKNLVIRLERILYTAAEAIRILAALLYPVLPYAAKKVWAQLGLGDIEAAAQRGELKSLQWGGLEPGSRLGELAPIFPRADKGMVQMMIDMESSSAPKPTLTDETPGRTQPGTATHSSAPDAPPRTSGLAEQNPGAHVGGSAAPVPELPQTPSHTQAPASAPFAADAAASTIPNTPQISIDDFVKIDLRVAKIVVAERIPKADKLLRLEVDLGYEKRQILSGIAEWYTPEELIGLRIVVIANLAPRKMRGLESHGMLLAASHEADGRPSLTTFSDEVELGSRVR